MAYHDIVIPNLGVQAVQRSLIEYLSGNEDLFASNREMLVDFFYGQQTDKDEYLKQFFNLETDPSKDPDYPHNLILTQANITAKIINKKAKSYRIQPVRMVDGKVSELYTETLLASGIKTSSKLIDRLTWLLGDHCAVFVADANLKRIRIDNPPYYRPVFMGSDSINPVGVLYPIGIRKNSRGEMVEAWQYWDKDNAIIFSGASLGDGSWEILDKKPNVHGCFNVIFTHRSKPFRSHWTQDAQDVVDGNRDINVALTSINNALRYQGFPILAGTGIDPKAVKNIKVRFDKMIGISANLDGTPVSLDFLYPNVNWGDLISVVKFRVDMIAMTWNVYVQWEISGDLASGVALRILSVDDLDDKDEIKELYEEFFEAPMFEIVKNISKSVDFMKEITGKKLTLQWPEEESFESVTETNERLKGEFDNNLSNPIDELMRRNPDLTEEEAIQRYKRNVKMNAMRSSSLPQSPLDKAIEDRKKAQGLEDLQ